MFFELEDIKRRHSVYFDIYNVGGWVPPPDRQTSSFRWNATRGVIVGVTANLISETWHNFFINWKLLLKEYVQPQNVKEFYRFAKATVELDNFKKSMRTRAQYAITVGAIDWGSRIAAFRAINGGWQRLWGSVEHHYLRKVPGVVLISGLTAPIGIPLEMARMAYYADKTFPTELQRGYTSYWNALRRIPFEEGKNISLIINTGPYFLFKNSFPLYIRNFFQTLTLFYAFDWLKDKSSVLWRIGDIPYYPCKIVCAGISTYLATIFSYPLCYVAKEIVDLWPREAGVPCNFNQNYRKAAVYLWYHPQLTQLWPGMLKNYFSRSGPMMFLTVMLADSFGIFSQARVDMFSGQGTNSWEDSFA